MDNKKYEQLIELIINEQEEKARELFHDIVVEKSREIYESIMDEEMMEAKDEEEAVEESAEDSEDAIEESMHDMDEGMVGQVGDLMDEISAEEAGDVVEAEDDADIEFDDEAEVAGDDLTHDLEKDHDAGSEDLEDRVVELDELMAEFEQIMGGDDEVGGEEEVEVSADDEEGGEEMMEAVQLKKVPGLYNSKIGGDNGANTKSPALTKPKVETAGVKPVKFSGDSEAVPTAPKAPSTYGTKGSRTKDAGSKFCSKASN